MQKINGLLILGAAVVGMVVSAAPAGAQTKEARGAVAAVTDKTMTVKTGAGEMTFYIDGETHLEVRSSARDVQAAQPGRPSARVNDFFEVGNPVMVRYREQNGRNHALIIERVGSPGGAKESSLAAGKVTAVSASHMTISSDGRNLTFAITGDTDVLARGASKATKAAGKGTPLTTFVHSGDEVSVTYQTTAGEMTASEIRVRVASR
jgi:hypothetical protein